MQPSLDEIQQSLNKASQLIIQVSKSVLQWKKNKNHSKISQLASVDKSSFDEESELPIERINSTAENYYKSVFENKDIVKLISLISTCITAIKRDVLRGTDQFAVYQFIWVKNRQTDLSLCSPSRRCPTLTRE